MAGTAGVSGLLIFFWYAMPAPKAPVTSAVVSAPVVPVPTPVITPTPTPVLVQHPKAKKRIVSRKADYLSAPQISRVKYKDPNTSVNWPVSKDSQVRYVSVAGVYKDGRETAISNAIDTRP